ncbi:MAG TPA: histidinol-phosphate transaminase [Firmicutes bacterium]|jgi:histidinol-phosphate aminotransferase|nr:histidinol-phosphate transaminase [Bacillota bacterium]
MQLPKSRAALARIEPYIPGKPIAEVQEELGLTDVIKMASNENPLGPSPKAVLAMQETLGAAHIYPDGAARALRQAIATHWHVLPEQVIVGNGSDEVLLLLATTYLEPSDAIMYGTPTFSEYAYAARVLGAKEIAVPLKDETFDLDAMLAAITPNTKLVFICNPNNPTGTYVNADAAQRFLDGVPPGVLVVFDEAYVEYADAPDFPDVLGLLAQGYPVATVRTFSKIYGLAGLRVGYLIGPEAVVADLHRIKQPFNVNAPAQAAAIAALEDQEHVEKSRRMNQAGKAQLYAIFDELGLRCWPSQSNFIFVDVGRPSQPVYEAVLQQGIILRSGAAFNRPNALRVTIGQEHENQRLGTVLKQVLQNLH